MTGGQLARTVLGPLTTTFVPPATCSVGVRACATCNYGWAAQTCGPKTIQDDINCWPPVSSGFKGATTAPLLGYGFYSPGLICPTGYTSACSATAEAVGTWVPQWSLGAGETAVGCCPSNYACSTNLHAGTNTCVSIARSTGAVLISTCSSGNALTASTVTVPFTNPSGPTPTQTVFSVYAPLVQLVYKATDLDGSPSATSSGPVATSSGPRATSVSQSMPTSPKNSTSSAKMSSSSSRSNSTTSSHAITTSSSSSSVSLSTTPTPTLSKPSGAGSVKSGIKSLLTIGGVMALAMLAM